MRVCLDVLTIKDVADDRILSVYPIYLSPSSIPFEEERQMSLCRLANKHYHSYSHLLLFFSLSFAFLSTEQGLRNKNVCAMLSYAAVHVSFVKNIVCN